MIRTLITAALAATALTASAHAGVVTGYIYLDSPAAGNATIANRPAGPWDATFTFNGTANFDNRSLSPVDSNFNTIDQFLATGGVAGIGGTVGSHAFNNTYFFFTGSVGLHAGANTFTITHDDGFEFDILSTAGIDFSAPGPTAPTPSTVIITVPTTGNYDFNFAYGETFGGPGVITVLGGTLQPVPEAASLAILGGGLGLLGLGLRRRAK